MLGHRGLLASALLLGVALARPAAVPARSGSRASAAGGSPAAATASFEATAASFVSPTRGWVLASSGCRTCLALARTSDGGRSWSSLPAPPAPLFWSTAPGAARQAASVRSVAFADTTDGYLWGPALYTTHDGGQSWRRQALGAVLQLVVGRRRAVALTERRRGSPDALWATPVGADRWHRVALPGPVRGDRVELAGQDGTLLLLDEGSTSVLARKTDLGRLWSTGANADSWRAVPLPCTVADGGAALAGVAHAHPRTWFVDCYDNEQSSQAQATRHRLYRTTTGGRRWELLGVPSRRGAPAAFAANGAGHELLATTSLQDALYGSFDGGRRWQQVLGDGGDFLGFAGPAFVTADFGYLVAPTHGLATKLYLTRDGGRVWRPTPVRAPGTTG